jgi:hypothetical protein
MAKVLSGWAVPRSYDWDPRAAMREKYGAYLSGKIPGDDGIYWAPRRDRAILIWRGIGWTATAGPVAARLLPVGLRTFQVLLAMFVGLASPGFGGSVVAEALIANTHLTVLTGSARLLLAWPVQILAAFGLAYALTIRLTALASHHRLKRAGGHLFGYKHLYREHWWDITPQSRGVNWGEKFLRRFLPGPKAHRYLTRTLIAVALCRFWWVGVAFGLSWWHWGLANTLAWLGMVGHRI